MEGSNSVKLHLTIPAEKPTEITHNMQTHYDFSDEEINGEP